MVFEEKEQQKLDVFVLLGDFLRQAKRMFFLGLALIVACSAGATVLARSTYTPYYEAYASFTVRVSNPLYSDISSYNEKTAQMMADTFPSLMGSDLLKYRVQEELGLSYTPSLSVTATAQGSLLTLSVRNSDPQTAFDILNAVIKCYPEISQFVVGSTQLVLLDESGLPSRPATSFNAKQHILLGATIGAIAWILILLGAIMLKNTVHNEEELHKVLNTPCLGQIPSVKTTKKMPCPLIFKLKGKSGFAESMRLLRLRIEKEMEAAEKRVLLVSSAIPGEGKTTIAINLAASLAQKGKSVLLLDCDLRNPSVAKNLSTTSHPLTGKNSLIDVLNGNIKVGDAIQTTGLSRLHVISGGPGGQAENVILLSQKRMALLIQVAKEQYDYIILDTPPCSMLADASELAELAEYGLLVIRQDYASRDQIMDGVQRLSDSNLPLIGCVLNNVRKNVSGDYGYGYGYGSDEKE